MPPSSPFSRDWTAGTGLVNSMDINNSETVFLFLVWRPGWWAPGRWRTWRKSPCVPLSFYLSAISPTPVLQLDPSLRGGSSNSQINPVFPARRTGRKAPGPWRMWTESPFVVVLSLLSHRIDTSVGPLFRVTNVAAVSYKKCCTIQFHKSHRDGKVQIKTVSPPLPWFLMERISRNLWKILTSSEWG